MTTDRRFCRFNRGPALSSGMIDDSPMTMKDVPEAGLCLSSFLVLLDGKTKNKVLMGMINPSAPWDHIGALDASRVAVHSKGWMLPSSHLIIYESPHEGAQRILREQLGVSGLALTGPIVVSEVYTPKRFADLQRHWDIEFIFLGELDDERPPISDVWRSLEFFDVKTLQKEKIARSHEDILKHAGVLA